MTEKQDDGIRLPVDQLKPGMRVSQDIIRDGFVLLSAGTELTPQLLRMLARWSVGTVAVVGTGQIDKANPAESRFSPEILQAARDQVNRRFIHVASDAPTVKQIRELAVFRLAEKLARQSQSRRPASS